MSPAPNEPRFPSDVLQFEPLVVPPAVAGDRAALRRVLAEARRDLAPAARADLDVAVCAQALRHGPLGQAPVVGLYRAFGAEVDTSALAAAVLARGGRVAWARISADEEVGLEFAVAQDWRTERNLPVPVGPALSLTAADLVVVPGLGFDLAGGRIGRGKGHYDRYLAHHPVPTLGLAYGCQVVDAVPMADHDRPMAALATEHGLWVFAKTSEDEV